MVNQYKVEAYTVDDAVTSQGTPVHLSIAEAPNGMVFLCTKHDSLYTSVEELVNTLKLAVPNLEGYLNASHE